MRQISIALSCISMFLLSVTSITVQELATGDRPIIYVLVSNIENVEVFNAVIDRVSANLDTAGVELGLVSNLSKKNLPINLELKVSDNGKLLELQSNSPTILAQSPILFAQLGRSMNEIPLGVTPLTSQVESIKFAADNITAIGFYSIGRCDLAQPYFEAASLFTTLSNYLYTEFHAGNCALVQGNYNLAATHFNNALVGGSTILETAVNLAWTTLQREPDEIWDVPINKFDDVVKMINCGDCDFERRNDIISRRTQLYALAEHYDDAISHLNDTIERTSHNQYLYILRGQMYLALYEWDSALADYNTAIELDPDYADAYYERGVLYYSILQTGVELRTDALADFQRYLELAPEGDKADDAARYVEQIETELETLNG